MKVTSARRVFCFRPDRMKIPRLRPEDFESSLFRQIDIDSDDTVSAGVCGFFDGGEEDVPTESGTLVLLGIRVATLKIPAKLVAAELKERCAAFERQDGRLPTRAEKAQAKEEIIRDLRRDTRPTVKHYQVIWDDAACVAYILTASESVAQLAADYLARALDARGELGQVAVESFFSWAHYTDRSLSERACTFGEFDASGWMGGALPPGPDFVTRVDQCFHLGQEFLLWALHRESLASADVRFATTDLPDGNEYAEIWSDDLLELVTRTNGAGAKFTGGHPATDPSVGRALARGWMPVSLRMIVRELYQDRSTDFVATMHADGALRGVRLPAVMKHDEEGAVLDTVNLLDRLYITLDAGRQQFLMERESQAWDEIFVKICTWAIEVAAGTDKTVQSNVEDADT